ncbi:MAG: SEC-C domain-containing protein [Anaerolineae bacterium]|nr:SEC-C domain-containing protein [Anaerolineae bacterium]
MFKNLLNRMAGNPYERELNRYRDIVERVNAFEPEMKSRSDADLRALTESFRERVRAATEGIEDDEEFLSAEREALDEILPEAFAAVREASVRAIGLRHFDVQTIGGTALHEGKITEMKTGEGKTLVATLPLYLNALTGRGAHLVTVNEYLARRDGGWMGPIYHLLGLTTGVIGKEELSAVYDPDYVDPGGDLQDERLVHWRPTLRRECYEADITYGTAPEFGFDYLRDNTAQEIERVSQRRYPDSHVYAIVDEVDSVLIDGARTPLIISGPADQASSQYARFAGIVEQARLRRNTTDIEHDEEPDGDYVLDDRTQSVALTDQGVEKIERLLPEIDIAAGQSLYDPQYYELVHFLENALKAKYVFKRDKDYFVQNGQVILIDQTTGRPMPSRRYSEGLHQAIEAKEGVQVKREDVTIATVTIQNYFRMYQKLAGMTGTAMTQAEEFDTVYKLDVVAIPTNVEYVAASGGLETRKEKIEGVPMITYWDPANPGHPSFYHRIDFSDEVYMTAHGKMSAVAAEIEALHEEGRPVLVGTGSVESSEYLSNILKKKGIKHWVLNAKNHDKEALIVAQAGQPGAITISTSMAGRGTDILLGGNPEGLAATYVSDACFPLPVFAPVVTDVVEGRLNVAREKAASSPLLGEEVIDWIVEAHQDLKRKIEVEDEMRQVVQDVREDKAYANIPFDTLVAITQQIGLAFLDMRRLDKARKIAEEHGAPLSLIPDIHFRLHEYRTLKGTLGQVGLVETLTRRLFEQHYNARAALVRAVLAGNEDEAREICRRMPALPEKLIEGTRNIVRECREARQAIWERGGLHIIGTERHESRRIDNQLRGRAARQGDPGSSRFYLSLEDELMIRFGGDRSKRLMERMNIPEDVPISAAILSNALEQAQGRFETFNFEIRKNLVEYDEAVNHQRQVVYDERRTILEGETGQLDEMIRTFIGEALEHLIERLRDDYATWAQGEIDQVMEDFSSIETGEVNTRGVVQRILALFPRPSDEEMQDLLAITDARDLSDKLHDLVLDGIDEDYHLLMLYAEIMRIVPIWPLLPAVGPRGVEGWDRFVNQCVETLEKYNTVMPEAEAVDLVSQLESGLENALRDYTISQGRGGKPQEAVATFYGQINQVFSETFRAVMVYLEADELIETLLARVDEVLEMARQEPGPNVPPFAIGPEELPRYQRALMLSVIDLEWRQYLTAIDDLRQGIGLEAFGQRDPKVQFKRRAADMFEMLRTDVREGIARRFFSDINRHRQIVEEQKRFEQLLDRLAQSGYRVQRKVSQDKNGQVKVAQTVHKDLWSKVGRNDPCPCGSGKKFKDCHYRQVQDQQQTVDQGTIVRGSSGKKKRKR